jgi:hypothetical protein
MMNTNEKNKDKDNDEHAEKVYAHDQSDPVDRTGMKTPPEPYVQLAYRGGGDSLYQHQSWKMEYDMRRREEMVDIMYVKKRAWCISKICSNPAFFSLSGTCFFLHSPVCDF